MMKRTQNKILRIIVNGPWIVGNTAIMRELKVEDIYEQVRRRNKLMIENYLTHSNPALRDLLSYVTVASSKIKRPKVAPMDQYLGRHY